MDMTSSQVVIIDIGSGITKAGFASSTLPPITVPTVVGKIKIKESISDDYKDELAGHDLTGKEGRYNLIRPVEHGVITSWDAFKFFLSHIYKEHLKTTPGSAPLFLAVSPLTSDSDMEKLVSILFNDFRVPACFIESHATLSLSLSEAKTGVVVDMGYDTVSVTPIVEGVNASRFMMGGRDLTEYMLKIMTEKGYSFTTAEERRSVEDIKSETAFVADDFQQTMATAACTSSLDKAFTNSDGETLTVGNERFRCPEVLFQPELLGMDKKGLPDFIETSIRHVFDELHRNIFLCGGSSLFNGLSERVKKELSLLTPPGQKINVTVLPEQKYSVWKGARERVSRPDFYTEWISRAEFEKEGPSVARRKCNMSS